MLLMLLLFLLFLVFLASFLKRFDLFKDLLHFQGIVYELVPSLELPLLDVDHWVFHHFQKGLVL